MKIHLVSDIHLEFSDYPYRAPKGTDVVIAAGDIYTKNLGPQALRTHFPDHPIIYITGNHEYYGGSVVEDSIELQEQAEKYDIRFLNPGFTIYEDVLFVGGTLWTDYLLHGEEFQKTCKFHGQDCMNDFRKISYSKKPWERFTPDKAEFLHKIHKEEISEGLSRAFEEGKKTVVVTHHAPHTKSLDPDYVNDHWLNASYASDLEKFILDTKPNLWVHGHIHCSKDYMVGETRIVANPRGYSHPKNPFDQQNKNFNKDLLIEI